jgi:hypothetical protein
MPKVPWLASSLLTSTLTTLPAKGLGAPTAPDAKKQSAPGEAPVASDSGNSNVGVDPSANNRGEKGIGGPNYGGN